MRYKFRAWDQENSKFLDLEWNDYYLDIDCGELYEIEERSANYQTYMHKRYLGNVVLQQWTGLTDRNGKELYEGDLGERDGIIYQVVWIEGSASYGVKVIKTNFVLTKGLTFPIQQYVINGLKCEFDIIGNIYEHPELLKV